MEHLEQVAQVRKQVTLAAFCAASRCRRKGRAGTRPVPRRCSSQSAVVERAAAPALLDCRRAWQYTMTGAGCSSAASRDVKTFRRRHSSDIRGGHVCGGRLQSCGHPNASCVASYTRPAPMGQRAVAARGADNLLREGDARERARSRPRASRRSRTSRHHLPHARAWREEELQRYWRITF